MRTLAELSIATGIDPLRLAELGDDWIATLFDVLDKRRSKA